ncbi:MAG: GNAT family N-acetyltransferase [bacterium]|nr:GNAT family N-acetyltransferase [bacterium]
MHTIYTGRKVRLRPLKSKEEFTSLILSCDCEPNAHWGPGWFPALAATKGFDEHGKMEGVAGENSFVIERLDTGEAVGLEFCGTFFPGAIAGWFGTDIAPAHRGQGFGKEAKLLMLCFLFENFPVHHIMSDTVADHWWARKGMEACGMNLLGRLTARLLREGQFYDVVWYGIKRPVWEKLEVREYVRRGEHFARPGVGQVPTPTG